MAPYPEGVKPNHYFHDSLGDPYTCTGDHNHPEDEDFARNTPQEEDQVRADLEERAAELAEQARCHACWTPVMSVGSSTVTIRLIGIEKLGDYHLCRFCTQDLKAMLCLTEPEDT